MTELFDEQIKQALENAYKLKLTGFDELSRQMSVKCVERAAEYNGTDMISLFYGESAYERIRDVTDAVKYIFIAKCAMRAYDVMYSKNSASYGAASWAKADKTTSNPQLKSFFEWLTKNRTVEERDSSYFRGVINALNSDNVKFRMSPRAASCTLVDIVKMLVEGSMIISSDGELR